MFEIVSSVSDSSYMRVNKDEVFIRPSDRPMRTVGGYFVLSPDQARGLVNQLHHWLENERVSDG